MRTGESSSFLIREHQGAISLEGRITSQAAEALIDAYAKSGSTGITRLDFSRMESIDVSGLNALVKLHNEARKRGGSLSAVGVSPAYRDVLIASRLDEAISLDVPACSAGVTDLLPEWPWARPVRKLKVPVVPRGALNLNIDGLSVAGPVQGFGPLWEKTYQVRLPGISAGPKDVIRAFKENFPSFQPAKNRFYPMPGGIAPGEVVIINAKTPAGLICTGVWVLYADDYSFTFITPQGHPESGWVSFTSFEDQGAVVAQVQGFARTSDPAFEIGFVLMGSKEQEGIWRHVLTSLARHFGIDADVRVKKTCVAGDYRWERSGNIRYNAQILTMGRLLARFTGLS